MLKKKLLGVGMAAALTFGFGFTGKADASAVYDKSHLNYGHPYVGKDGHIYIYHYTFSLSTTPTFGLYKMYDLENGIISAVNLYDDTDIIRFSENMYEFKNQGYIRAAFTEKNNNDYKIIGISENNHNFDGLLHMQELDNKYDVHTYKVTWTDDKYVYLYTKNHANPHEIKLPKEGFERFTAGDWLWAKVSEDTWEWVDYGKLPPRSAYYGK